MAYLTPNTPPAEVTCRAFFIPNSPEWIALVTGALLQLSEAYNFTPFGTATPAETAAVFFDMCNNFIANKRGCKMIGEIVLWGGDYSPDGLWLPCDGTSLLRADFPDLFAVIGTLYGAVDSTHFNLPDLRGNVPVGATASKPVGSYYGEATHTLDVNEIPAHTHGESIAVPTLINGGLEAPATSATSSTGITGSTGGGLAHNNIQPSLSITYWIVAR